MSIYGLLVLKSSRFFDNRKTLADVASLKTVSIRSHYAYLLIAIMQNCKYVHTFSMYFILV